MEPVHMMNWLILLGVIQKNGVMPLKNLQGRQFIIIDLTRAPLYSFGLGHAFKIEYRE